MISIIIPLYNKEQYISRAIQSVLDQTFQEFEIVIVNDGSTDNSVAEVEKFDDLRIHLIHQKNAGVSAARNRGIEEAKYELIAFLDADDLWEKDFLETVMRLKKKYEKCSVFAVNYKILMYDGSIKSTVINGLPKNFKEGILENYFYVAYQSDPIICSISLMVKKEAIKSIGGFPEGILAGEDLLTWARLAYKFKIAYTIESKAFFYREFVGSKINQNARELDKHDYVGNELEKLYYKRKNDIALKKYIGYWYTIRTESYIRFGLKKKAYVYISKMIKYQAKKKKILFFILINSLPKIITKKIYLIFIELRKKGVS